MKEYSLTINAKQAHIMVKALDLYSRLLSGQIEELGPFFRFHGMRQVKDQSLFEIKRQLFPELESNAGYSIGAKETDPKAQIAWDIQQVIRHQLAWDNNPQGGFTVDYDEPFASSDQPLPTILSRKPTTNKKEGK